MDTPPSSVHAPPPPLPTMNENEELDQKMGEFKRYLSAKSSSSAGPDLMFNVSEYATFLPRPHGVKERPQEKSPYLGSNKNNDWIVPPSPPRTVSGYAAGFGPLLGPNIRSNKITYHQMIAKLPVMMSPTIPTWTVPARPMTGGKQPGKVPAVPPDLGASSDDSSSDSDRESDHQSSAADSESVIMSETDANPRYKSIGRKTAQRRNSKTGMMASKRLTGTISEKSDTLTGPSSEYCYLLSSEETKELPHRIGKAFLSKSPSVVRINIPSFLLPELETRLKTLSSSSSSKFPSTHSLSPPDSLGHKNKSGSKKYYSEGESNRKSTKRSRVHSNGSDSDSNSGSERSESYSKHTRKGDRYSKHETEKSRESRLSLSPSLDRKKQSNGRISSRGDYNDSKPKDIIDNRSRSTAPLDKSTSSRRRRSESGSLSPDSSTSRSYRKDLRDETRDNSSGKIRSSKEDPIQRARNSSHRDDRGGSTKQRSRVYSRSRSRSRSPARSRRRSRDRNDEHETKTSKSRRDNDDDRSSSKTKRKRDTSREYYEKSTKGRRDKSRSRSPKRDESRDSRRERKRQRSRSLSRDRSDARREKDKHRREMSSSKGMADVNVESQAQTSPVFRRKDIENSRVPSTSAQPSAETGKARAASPTRTFSDTQPQQDLTSSTASATINTAATTTTTTPTVKKFSMEDYQKRRLESDVGTPKTTTDSPTISSSSTVPSNSSSEQAQGGSKRVSALPGEPSLSQQSKYYREYQRFHKLAISLKRKADEISHAQENPRLGAIVYFLSGNAFMRAFHFNDRHFDTLHGKSRQDMVLRESMKCWSSMKQFTTALSAQCCDKFPGLNGLSYLLEALIYYKCHTYTNQRLRIEMQSTDQFKKRPPKDGSSTQPAMIPSNLASKVLQYTEDWANLSAKLEECEVALTPNIAREQFPETFKKWCIHPENLGKAESFSMNVEQKQKIAVGVVDGVVVYDEKVRIIPKIMWPLGTHMHLSNLMDFAEEALHEYQVRNNLEYDVSL
ncbi:hypothetical protein BGZ46_000359 [Entomortierella lignicola]|nr:hypothetical protein BGZ46_000359 [Entomortierella lignicola]